MRKNASNGLDYLPDYFDYFITDPRRECIVGEIEGQVVSITKLSIPKIVLGENVWNAYERPTKSSESKIFVINI